MGYLIDKNAKNVWVRDHADTEDLSVIPNANSVYFNNGRTMEQEFGKGTMVSNIVTVDSPMEKVVEGTYDGTYESCKMYGKSLVNVMTKVIDATWNLNLTNWSIETTSPSDLILKPNTMYSVIVYVTEKTCPDRDDLFWVGDVDGNKNKITHDIVRKNVTLGANVFVINTVSDFSNLSSNKGGINFQGSKFVEGTLKWKAIVLEGDWTDKEVPPYFTGLCDVKMPILRNVGKNLFDVNMTNFTNVTAIPMDGSLIIKKNISTHYYSRTPICLKPNTEYTFKCNTYRESDTETCVKLHLGARPHNDSLEYGAYVVPVGDGTFSKTFTTNSLGELYINGYTTTKGILFSNIQLEESSTVTTYEPYKTNILETSNDVVLRGLPNGVRDSYDCLTGEYVQRVGEVSLHELNFGFAEMKGEYYRFGVDLQDAKHYHGYSISCISDKMVIGNTDIEATQEQLCMYGHSDYVELRLTIHPSKLNNDTSKITEYLTNNQVKIQYELAEPIVTTVEPSTTPFAYENGHIILESGHEGQSLLPTLEYQTVVSRSGQVAMIDKTIQQHERKITLLEKMLVQNIIDIEYKNTLLALKLEIDEVI